MVKLVLEGLYATQHHMKRWRLLEGIKSISLESFQRELKQLQK